MSECLAFSAILSATTDMVFDYLRGFKVTPKIVLESGNIDLMQEPVSQDNGVSLPNHARMPCSSGRG
jgi:hypothetical protein